MRRSLAAEGTLIALLGSMPAYGLDTPQPPPDGPATTVAPVAANPAPAAKPPATDESSRSELVWEWDPYYSDVDYNVPLTSKPIPTISSDSEAVIYRDLIEGSLIPRYMLLEASVYPLPVLGTYLKSHTPGFYKEGEISHTGLNVIESATAGFQEPWAVSAFFGNIANLERPGETQTGTNLGYTGYLISAGSKHIKDNVLVDDDWYEVEWKIKGDIHEKEEKLSWSFRVGANFNANPDVTDTMYVGIHRTNLDFNQPFLSWFKNSAVDVQVSFSQHGGKAVREELVFGKKYPFPEQGYSITLDTGFIWESPEEYSGVLRTDNKSTLTFVFRPGLEF